MRLTRKILAGALVTLASGLALADGVDWAQASASGTLVVGGRGAHGESLYVCRSGLADGVVAVGRFTTSGDGAGECRIATNGAEQAVAGFDVLVAKPSAEGVTKWLPGYSMSHPQWSVLAGQAADGQQWLVCSALDDDGSMQPGYNDGENCVYGYGGKQKVSATYLVLASSDPTTPATEDAQPATEGFDPGTILARKGITDFCALATDSCARELPTPAAATAAQ